MSKDEEIKRLKEKIEELEFIKEFQQDIIADLEVTTGQTLAKKCLPAQQKDFMRQVREGKIKIA